MTNSNTTALAQGLMFVGTNAVYVYESGRRESLVCVGVVLEEGKPCVVLDDLECATHLVPIESYKPEMEIH